MFSQKNDNKNPSLISAAANNANIADPPIHTMKKDMEDIQKYGLIKPVSDQLVEKAPPSATFTPTNEKQKTSPFLNTPSSGEEIKTATENQKNSRTPINLPTQFSLSSNVNHAAPNTTLPSNNPVRATNTKKTVIPKDPIPKEAIEQNKSVLTYTVIITVTILFAGIGGYYFWATRKVPTAPTVQSPIETPASSMAPTEPEKPDVSSSVMDKPIISLDIDKTDSANIKKSIDTNVKKIVSEKITTPVAFTIADLKNNSVNFQVFATKFGIKLSPALISNLGDNFDLYIYNDSNKPHLGIVIDTRKDEETVKNSLAAEEAILSKEIEPLFFENTPYTIKNVAFSSSVYNSLRIRYSNIVSPEELSIDYAIYKNKLVIGTSKMTLRSIIDKLTSEMTESTNNDTTRIEH